jgi:histone deacetylase complex regulatory component SIN3
MNSLKAETVSNSTEQEVYDQLLAIITLYTQAVVIKDKLFRTDFFLKSDTTLKVNKELDALRKIAFNLQ